MLKILSYSVKDLLFPIKLVIHIGNLSTKGVGTWTDYIKHETLTGWEINIFKIIDTRFSFKINL